jgi:hypothetical protein
MSFLLEVSPRVSLALGLFYGHIESFGILRRLQRTWKRRCMLGTSLVYTVRLIPTLSTAPRQH